MRLWVASKHPHGAFIWLTVDTKRNRNRIGFTVRGRKSGHENAYVYVCFSGIKIKVSTGYFPNNLRRPRFAVFL
jgi:hypothetical protein